MTCQSSVTRRGHNGSLIWGTRKAAIAPKQNGTEYTAVRKLRDKMHEHSHCFANKLCKSLEDGEMVQESIAEGWVDPYG